MKHDKVTPYQSSDTKKEQVANMFNNIAAQYDFLNRFLSLGIDILWRRKAINLLKEKKPKTFLDVATGTGDVAIEISRQLKPTSITGIDISRDMLEVGRKKIAKKKLDGIIDMVEGDAENLPFDDNTFDAVTASFGVRNFENLESGLSDMRRVLKNGGQLLIIEFSQPQKFPFKQLYFFYFKNVLPLIGKLISKDPRAYTYLPESVSSFPYGDDFLSLLGKTGFNETRCIPLTFGIASIYLATK